MICTCPSCPFCAETLRHYGVTNRSPSGATSRQTGWVHPFERYYFGSVYPGTEAQQVSALSAFHARGTVPALGGTGPTAPREGQYETLDF